MLPMQLEVMESKQRFGCSQLHEKAHQWKVQLICG